MDRNEDGHHRHHHIDLLCPHEHITTAFQSLDTVRALHHTVISLRAALEDAHREIDNLKKNISIQTVIDDGKVYHQQQQQLDVGSGLDETISTGVQTDLLTTSERPEPKNPVVSIEEPKLKEQPIVEEKLSSLSPRKKSRKATSKGKYELGDTIRSGLPDIRITSGGSNHHHKQMASKIDVKIKVSSNIKVEGPAADSSTDPTTDTSGNI